MAKSGTKPLEKEIAAYVSMQKELEKHHMGKWAVFHAAELFSVFDSYENALFMAASNFGSGPYLIRQVGRTPTNVSLARINKFSLATS